MHRERSSAKTAKAERNGSNQPHFQTVEDEHQDGHTADRTNILPWESCGPDCPVCAEFER